MDAIFYTVTKISGDYGHMISDQGVENLVALAFLPMEVEVGSRLRWENFEYTMA